MEGTGIGVEPHAQQTAGISYADAASEISNAVVAYLPRFYKIAIGRLGNVADAEDAIQNALLLAWKNIKQFKGQSHISTWITSILVNSTRQVLRKRRRHTYDSLDDQDPNETLPAKSEMVSDHRPGPEELCRRWELAERAILLSHELSPMLQKAFEVRDLHGLSVKEAGQVLGIKPNTVKARSRRAHAALRRVMDKRHSEKSERV
jgi:RNA polymerase sigma-70 factor (ECF subfamily)